MLKQLGLGDGTMLGHEFEAIRRCEMAARVKRTCFAWPKKQWVSALLSPNSRAARSSARARERCPPVRMSAFAMKAYDSSDSDDANEEPSSTAELSAEDTKLMRDLDRAAWKLFFQGHAQLRIGLQRYLL